jgi:hypothetical protein
MLKTMEYSGEGDAAEKLYQQGARWWPARRGPSYLQLAERTGLLAYW